MDCLREQPQQPATLTFRMAPVDIDLFKAEGRPRFRELVREARAAGYNLPSESGSLHASAVPGVAVEAPASLVVLMTLLPAGNDPRTAMKTSTWDRRSLASLDSTNARQLQTLIHIAAVSPGAINRTSKK